jgi:hypothetical protein
LMKCYAESSVIVNAWTFSFPNRHWKPKLRMPPRSPNK